MMIHRSARFYSGIKCSSLDANAGHKATYHIDWNMTPKSPAAFTCLHVVTVTHYVPGAPGGVAAGFSHLVQLVLGHPVPLQAEI